MQSVGARRAATATGVGGVIGILTQLPYVAGLALDGVGFAGNVVALRQLPLFLVEAIVAGSVGVTAVIAALRGEKLGAKDWTALGVLGLGLVLLSASASPAEANATSVARDWTILAFALVPAALGVVGWRLVGSPSVLLANPLLGAIIAYGALAISFFGVALQRGQVTVVAAVTFVIEVVVPSALGLLFFGDEVAAGRDLVAGAGFLLAIGGTIALSRFAE